MILISLDIDSTLKDVEDAIIGDLDWEKWENQDTYGS
jgi:hypothetical protein